MSRPTQEEALKQTILRLERIRKEEMESVQKEWKGVRRDLSFRSLAEEAVKRILQSRISGKMKLITVGAAILGAFIYYKQKKKKTQ